MNKNIPPIDQIFDDLDDYRDYCRYNGKVFDEKALYNEKDYNWNEYKKFLEMSKMNKNRPRRRNKNA